MVRENCFVCYSVLFLIASCTYSNMLISVFPSSANKLEKSFMLTFGRTATFMKEIETSFQYFM